MVKLDMLLRMMECETQEDWSSVLFALAANYGFQQAVISIVNNRYASLEPDFLQSNYSKDWLGKYASEKMQYFDPTVRHCLHSNLPLVWHPPTFRGTKQYELYEEACAYGIRSGITFPMHGAGAESGLMGFVSGSTADKNFLAELGNILPELALIRDYAFESSRRFVLPFAEESLHLTPREVECLKWAMEGKTAWEISVIMHCSEDTVNFHFKNLRRKFNVNTRQQVVVKAIRLGIIVPG